MAVAALFLASRELPGIEEFLARHPRPGRVQLVTTAANPLEDRAKTVNRMHKTLAAHDLAADELDLESAAPGEVSQALESCSVLVVGGGNPFHLLSVMRQGGSDLVVSDVVRAGLPYVGISAGSIVAGPDLRASAIAGAFEPPRDLDLRGLGLSGTAVLPHDNRPQRRERNKEAIAALGGEFEIRRLADDEVLIIE